MILGTLPAAAVRPGDRVMLDGRAHEVAAVRGGPEPFTVLVEFATPVPASTWPVAAPVTVAL